MGDLSEIRDLLNEYEQLSSFLPQIVGTMPTQLKNMEMPYGLSRQRSGKRDHDGIKGIINSYFPAGSDQVTAQVRDAHKRTWSVDKFNDLAQDFICCGTDENS